MGQVEIGPGGAFGSAQQRQYGIQVLVPLIPLWVPEQAKAELTDLVLSSLRLALQTAAGYISDEAPVSEGSLAQSFGADPANSTGGIEMLGQDTQGNMNGRVFSSLPYAIVMDQGRRPGQPINRAGIDAIGLWAQRKLGLTADQADEAKWAIASSIVTHGIAGTDYFDKGTKRADPVIQRMFTILGEQIMHGLTTEGGA